jgi:hypothetical protein
MPRGGKRPGSGRKLGSVTKRTREIADGALAAGLSPLQFLLSVMRDETQPAQRRDWAAAIALPFTSARLAMIGMAPGGAASMMISTVVVNAVESGRFFDGDTVTIEPDSVDHDASNLVPFRSQSRE